MNVTLEEKMQGLATLIRDATKKQISAANLTATRAKGKELINAKDMFVNILSERVPQDEVSQKAFHQLMTTVENP